MKLTPKYIHKLKYFTDIHQLAVVAIFHPVQKEWKFYGWGCQYCKRTLKSEQVARNHINACRFKTKFPTDDDTENIT